MRKPVYLAVVGVSIVVSAVSLGVALTRYVSLRAYAPKAPLRTSAAAPVRPASSVPLDQWRNLFAPSQGMKIPSRLPTVSAKGAQPAVRSNFVLVGTITSPDPSSRRAALWTNGMKEPRLFRENEEVEPGAFLTSIERDKVWITRGGERQMLELLPVGSRTRASAPPEAPVPAARAAAMPAAAPSPGPLHVTRLGDSTFTIDEAGIDQISKNINQFMTQVRIVPYFEGNRSAGYRIAAIRPGTAFEQLGFQGGDVLQQVNGVELSSPEKMYTIFQNLKDEKTVAVNILRQGRKNTLTYEVR